MHETRLDYAQLLVCLFLLVEGAGVRSLDRLFRKEVVYTVK